MWIAASIIRKLGERLDRLAHVGHTPGVEAEELLSCEILELLEQLARPPADRGLAERLDRLEHEHVGHEPGGEAEGLNHLDRAVSAHGDEARAQASLDHVVTYMAARQRGWIASIMWSAHMAPRQR